MIPDRKIPNRQIFPADEISRGGAMKKNLGNPRRRSIAPVRLFKIVREQTIRRCCLRQKPQRHPAQWPKLKASVGYFARSSAAVASPHRRR
jgi:hypothetical protein